MARFILLGVFLVLLSAFSLRASESDELREKAKAMLREAAALSEKGHKEEEAEQLRTKANELLKVAEQRDQEQKRADKKHHSKDQEPGIDNLERHLKDLLTKEQEAKESNAPKEALVELRKHIEGTKAKIDSLRSGQKHGPHAADRGVPGHELKQKMAQSVERLQHLRMAADHLRAAGAVELSQQVAGQAEQVEQEVRQMKEHLAKEMAAHEGGPPNQLEELRREIQRLRAEVEELRRQKSEK